MLTTCGCTSAFYTFHQYLLFNVSCPLCAEPHPVPWQGFCLNLSGSGWMHLNSPSKALSQWWGRAGFGPNGQRSTAQRTAGWDSGRCLPCRKKGKTCKNVCTLMSRKVQRNMNTALHPQVIACVCLYMFLHLTSANSAPCIRQAQYSTRCALKSGLARSLVILFAL